MDFPDVDLQELEAFKKKNFEDRLEFIKWYAAWVRETDNKTWSRAQKKVIDQK